jgi:hypothetical protein
MSCAGWLGGGKLRMQEILGRHTECVGYAQDNLKDFILLEFKFNISLSFI